MSSSTVETQRGLDNMGAEAFRIVIDRPNTASKSDESRQLFPGLEVPIPHYRLGTPRFSAMGTAFLHQSLYTRSSDQESSLITGPRHTGIDAHTAISRRHSHASHATHTQPAISARANQAVPVVVRAPSLHRAKGPITPQIYESLAKFPDDPAIVKYSPVSGDIIAASPARIIAQITSENFLDYELLSDFFLTVRCYLSTHDLLAYLLARFEWAINRFDDNGRVIRVRAFAALRHWILNYFSYDFVVDRDLRVQFCNRLNALTRIVKARADYGASDMKLIADLKKCWNGRCMLFWDSAPTPAEQLQELDIQPGGILGSRNSQLEDYSQLHASAPDSELPTPQPHPDHLVAQATSIAHWNTAVVEHAQRQAQGHARQISDGTSRSFPISPMSEQSVPALSCSIPTGKFRKAAPYANKAMNIHPVPTNAEGRRVCPAAPSASVPVEPVRPVTAHRRSGSFSDATRDKRAPLSSDIPNISVEFVQEHFRDRSLLRGHVIPPGAPYVTPIPLTPATDLGTNALLPTPSKENDAQNNRKTASQANPAMKGIISNIRRALSSKHSGSNTPTGGGPTASMPGLPTGKGATIPLNIMYQVQDGHIEAFTSQLRIDVLAAEANEAYRRAVATQAAINPSSIGLASGNEREQPSPFGERAPSNNAESTANHLLRAPEMKRLASGITDSSQSILIADDTGLNIPDVPPFPRSLSNLNHVLPERSGSSPSPFHAADSGLQPPLATDGEPQRSSSAPPPSELPHNHTAPPAEPLTRPPIERRPPMASRQFTHRSNDSVSSPLRRYASFQSTFSKHGAGKSIDNTVTTHSNSIQSVLAKEEPARLLRRRPGGDLRANQNVHDLEAVARPRSTGSIAAYSESVRESEMLTFGDKIAKTFAPRKASREDRENAALAAAAAAAAPADTRGTVRASAQSNPSFMHTHSSQPEQRRPSFEAAVARFARIPDDDEGGLEATLLKLEGRYQKSPTTSTRPGESNGSQEALLKRDESGVSRTETAPASSVDRPAGASMLAQSAHVQGTNSQSTHEGAPALYDLQMSAQQPRETVVSTTYAESEESFNPVPLLERGADDWSEESKGKDKGLLQTSTSANGSKESVETSYSMRMLKQGSIAPSATIDSFLLEEDDEFLSDVSSDLSDGTIEASGAPEMQHPSQTQPPAQSDDMVLMGKHHPPSPPMTMENAMSITSQAKLAHEERKPPTPKPSPVHTAAQPADAPPPPAMPPLPPSRHMPYILGYDSEALAQQFTLVEKDALREVDWRDLVDMRWLDTASAATNWVDYLLAADPPGLDLVTARFNMVVKWAVSEILLTERLEERAQTIAKYVRVAQKARKMHNFATMLQITVALTSSDVARLHRTWEAVPRAEKEALVELETLVSPRKNFGELRQEMERANLDHGCIPVVGKML